MSILQTFERCGIIPVVVLEKSSDAVPLTKALLAGGINVAEVTFRTEAAEESIRLIADQVPEMLVGAGTVLTLGQLDRAYQAGARFIVSPGFDPKLVERCRELELPIFPGAVTPTEIMQILNEGLDIVKFFPAGNFGGLKTMKSLAAPFTNIRFMPTGGVNADNLAEFLEFDKILAVGGSWICSSKLVKEGKFDEITKLCKEAKDIFHRVRG